jgi:hypothetical protein
MSFISVADAKLNTFKFKKSLGSKNGSREFDILEKVYCYFSTPGRIDEIVPYLEEHNNAMSLRDFESFNIHVAPWINSCYYRDQVMPGTNGKTSKELYIVYQKYKAYLKCYNKETFDPFRRGIAFEFYYTYIDPESGGYEQKSVFTSICQLNYFIWCHKDGVLDYIKENNEMIMRIIKKLDAIKKLMTKDEFKDLIIEKQRYPRCYMVDNISLSRTLTACDQGIAPSPCNA